MPTSVAIIGSGPAGFYAADALLKACDSCEIDIIERLPTPFGLVRGGVAPDHQSTKRVVEKFERTAMAEAVNYYGNVEVNRDVGLAELRQIYDAVILAIGAPKDRTLNIPGADKHGVYGSAALVGWYNGHPDFQFLEPDLAASAAVIGHGNVAVDVARALLRSPDEMRRLDIPDYAQARIESAAISDIHLVGRRGPLQGKFSDLELRELLEMQDAVPLVRADQLPSDADLALGGLDDRERRAHQHNLATLRAFSAHRREEKPKAIHIEFCARPVEVLGGDRVTGLRLERTRLIGSTVEARAEGTGETFDIDCGLIVTAIGYRADPMDGAPYDVERGIIQNDQGRVDDGLYCVGWIQHGPRGVISSNRDDGRAVAEQISQAFGGGSEKIGRAGFESMLAERRVRRVSFADWKRLEAMEVANAEDGAPRRKFVSVEEMLEAI